MNTLHTDARIETAVDTFVQTSLLDTHHTNARIETQTGRGTLPYANDTLHADARIEIYMLGSPTVLPLNANQANTKTIQADRNQLLSRYALQRYGSRNHVNDDRKTRTRFIRTRKQKHDCGNQSSLRHKRRRESICE